MYSDGRHIFVISDFNNEWLSIIKKGLSGSSTIYTHVIYTIYKEINVSSYRDPMNYWEQGDVRPNQHFYISYCLMSTVLLNYAASKLLVRKKYPEWAIVSGYYSVFIS